MLAPGDEVHRYLIERELGQGAMAVVYLARHTQLGTAVAIKVLKAAPPSVRQRLLREGKVQASLNHPNIVAVRDVFEVDGHPALVLEYVDGPSLEAYLADRKLQLTEADTLARGIVAGIQVAHDRGFIHRDLKPANVMLSRDHGRWAPRITDFGLAKILDPDRSESLTRQGTGMGTPAYMAPEQVWDAKVVDRRADIFSLGAILYELVCGARAFPGDTLGSVLAKAAGAEFIPPEQHAPGLPDQIYRAIRGALAPDAENRIPDCRTLMAVWEGARTWTPSAEDPGASIHGTWNGERAPEPPREERPSPPHPAREPLDARRQILPIAPVEDPADTYDAVQRALAGRAQLASAAPAGGAPAERARPTLAPTEAGSTGVAAEAEGTVTDLLETLHEGRWGNREPAPDETIGAWLEEVPTVSPPPAAPAPPGPDETIGAFMIEDDAPQSSAPRQVGSAPIRGRPAEHREIGEGPRDGGWSPRTMQYLLLALIAWGVVSVLLIIALAVALVVLT